MQAYNVFAATRHLQERLVEAGMEISHYGDDSDYAGDFPGDNTLLPGSEDSVHPSDDEGAELDDATADRGELLCSRGFRDSLLKAHSWNIGPGDFQRRFLGGSLFFCVIRELCCW
jgi:hypothetical protein